MRILIDKPYPRHNDRRIEKKFILFPKILKRFSDFKRELRWLEYCEILGVYVNAEGDWIDNFPHLNLSWNFFWYDEQHKMKKLYHASPENFNVFSPKYNKKMGSKGVFFSPNFYSLLKDWMRDYIFWKKYKKNQGCKNYKYLWVYTVECPEDIYIISDKNFIKKLEVEKDEHRLFSFWLWGEQVFIEEKYLKKLKIIGKNKWTYSQCLNLQKRIANLKWEHMSKGYKKTF